MAAPGRAGVLGLAMLLALVAAAAGRLLGEAADLGIDAATASPTGGSAGSLTPAAEADLVLTVPGYSSPNALPSRHFAGYVEVDEAHGRNLFYYFVESERDPANDPVVLWMNG